MLIAPLVVELLSDDKVCGAVLRVFSGKTLSVVFLLDFCNRYAGFTLPDVSGFIGLKFDG
jgi:hypothetical protein